MTMTTEELAEQADDLARKFVERRTFDEARAALNEAGMNKARQRLHDALKTIEQTQATLRSVQDAAQQMKARVDQALAEAEWELDARFYIAGNKTFLVLNPADGTELPENLKAMTADERAKWKQTEARKQTTVLDALAAQREADRLVAEGRDALTVAELAFRAARADLDAAIATVQILGQSLKKEVQA